MKLKTVPEAAEMMRIRNGTLLIWLSRGKLPFFKVGRRTLLAEADIRDFIASGRRPGLPTSGESPQQFPAVGSSTDPSDDET